MKTTESYPLLLEALHDVRARWRRNKILEGSLLALAGVAVVLTALGRRRQPLATRHDRPLPAGRPAVGRTGLVAVRAGGAARAGGPARRLLRRPRRAETSGVAQPAHQRPPTRPRRTARLLAGTDPGHRRRRRQDRRRHGHERQHRPQAGQAGGRSSPWSACWSSPATRPPSRRSSARALSASCCRSPTRRRTRGRTSSRSSRAQGEAACRKGRTWPSASPSRASIPPAARLYHRTEGGAWRDDEMPADKGKAGVFHATVSHVMEVVRLLRHGRRRPFGGVPRRGGQAAAPGKPDADLRLPGLPRPIRGARRRLRRRGRGRGRHDRRPGSEGEQAPQGSGIEDGKGRNRRAGEARRRPHLGRFVRGLGGERQGVAGDQGPAARPLRRLMGSTW